ncbi:calcium-binding protein [Roseivivax sp. CAU 1761]
MRLARRLAALALAALPVLAAPATAERVYVYGNSLVHHPEAAATNVPYWLAEMAEAGGRSLALAGQWGFLRDFAAKPPAPQWSGPGIAEFRPEGAGAPDTVIIAPANFIQDQPADAAYRGDATSPLEATLAVIDRSLEAAPGARILIYEGWPDMAPFLRRFPPAERGLARYHAFAQGAYHAWFRDYVAALRAARPEARIALAPVAPLLSRAMGAAPLDALAAEDFYLDDAPHGTEATYFLAAMALYAALFDAAPPEGYAPPESLPEALRRAYPTLRLTMQEGLAELAAAAPEAAAATVRSAGTAPDAETGAQAGADTAPLPARETVELPPRGARPDGAPALAMGLNGIADWSTQHPFLDVMKTAREWIGHLPGQWGGVSAAELRAAGDLDAEGWPLRIPEGVDRLETFVLTDQPEAAQHLRGHYVLRHQGQGRIELSGRARRVHYQPGEIRFFYEPGDGPVGIVLHETDAADPVRAISIVREAHLPLHEAGALFNPEWLARIEDLRVVRFMDWMLTNGSPVESWADRPRLGDYTWSAWGVPLPVMIALANRIGADPWFTLPHRADDAYVRRFAEAVRDGLDPRLKAYVEYSNEVWNGIFPQHAWAQAQAETRWGTAGDGFAQFYGLRAAEIMDIWSEVFGTEAPRRLVRVIAVHTGWPELEEAMLTAPLAYLDLGRMPRESFDAYAVAGYFGHDLADEDNAARLAGWLDRAEEAARAEGEAQGLRRVALREHVRARRFAPAFGAAAEAIAAGSMRRLTEELLPYHVAAAREAGLSAVMYEGGSHAVARGAALEEARITDFLAAFAYSPEMAGLYRDLMAEWLSLGGRLFNAFVDVAAPSKWGAWGALRHLDDANPRWDVLMAHNATAPVDWESRDPAAFANGVLRRAGTGGAELSGTAEEDVLIGGPGADVLIGNGGSDHLHGGAGRDRAVLPGRRAEYEERRAPDRLTLRRGRETVILVSVEEVVFAADEAAN